jgi:hypothetical protein
MLTEEIHLILQNFALQRVSEEALKEQASSAMSLFNFRIN